MNFSSANDHEERNGLSVDNERTNERSDYRLLCELIARWMKSDGDVRLCLWGAGEERLVRTTKVRTILAALLVTVSTSIDFISYRIGAAT